MTSSFRATDTFFGREPDAGGYAAYQDALTKQNGGITPKGFMERLANSEEAQALKDNGIDPELKYALVQLPEDTFLDPGDLNLLRDLRLSDREFVAKSFDALLQRPASAGDVQWYALQLQQGNQDRAGLITTLVESTSMPKSLFETALPMKWASMGKSTTHPVTRGHLCRHAVSRGSGRGWLSPTNTDFCSVAG